MGVHGHKYLHTPFTFENPPHAAADKLVHENMFTRVMTGFPKLISCGPFILKLILGKEIITVIIALMIILSNVQRQPDKVATNN